MTENEQIADMILSYHKMYSLYRQLEFSGMSKHLEELMKSYETFKSSVPEEVYEILVHREMEVERNSATDSVLKHLEKMFK